MRTSAGVDLWPLRAMSIAVDASAADVSDNRPLSGGCAAGGGHWASDNFVWVLKGLAERDAGPAAVTMTLPLRRRRALIRMDRVEAATGTPWASGNPWSPYPHPSCGNAAVS